MTEIYKGTEVGVALQEAQARADEYLACLEDSTTSEDTRYAACWQEVSPPSP